MLGYSLAGGWFVHWKNCTRTHSKPGAVNNSRRVMLHNWRSVTSCRSLVTRAGDTLQKANATLPHLPYRLKSDRSIILLFTVTLSFELLIMKPASSSLSLLAFPVARNGCSRGVVGIVRCQRTEMTLRPPFSYAIWLRGSWNGSLRTFEGFHLIKLTSSRNAMLYLVALYLFMDPGRQSSWLSSSTTCDHGI